MLDAYIIERIRKERDTERERGAFIPLRIETPQHRPEAAEEREDDEERGSIVIDFQL